LRDKFPQVDEELLTKIQSEKQENSQTRGESKNQEETHDQQPLKENEVEDDFEQRMLNKIREKRKKAETKNKSFSSSSVRGHLFDHH
jgi:hypothetical protein